MFFKLYLQVNGFQVVFTFYIKLSEKLGGNLLELVVAPDENVLFYGFNVLVLVELITPNIYEIVARIEEEVSKKYDWKPSISSYVTRNTALTDYLKRQLKWKNMKS